MTKNHGAHAPNPLDRLFIEDADDRPDEIVVDELTTLDADEFVDRIESIADASAAITTMAEDLERLRGTGLSGEDARDLIYGRNRALTKSEIDAIFDAIDQLQDGRADRPTERLLSALTGLTLTECGEALSELERLNSKYGDRDA